jgi:hypothetical protein
MLAIFSAKLCSLFGAFPISEPIFWLDVSCLALSVATRARTDTISSFSVELDMVD